MRVTIPASHQAQLEEQGFVVLPDFMDGRLLRALRERVETLFQQEGPQAGTEFKPEAGSRRLANLIDKGEVFLDVVGHDRLLAYVERVLGTDYTLSSLNVRSANPHNGVTQPLHADMGALPDEGGSWVCNSLWRVDDFTPQNGPLRIVPGSHRRGRLPQEALADPTARQPDEVVVTGRAGTVLVMNAHLWHGGLPNRTGRPRTALHAFFCRRDKPQQQYQKRLVRPEVQESLSPKLRHILALDVPHNDRLRTDDPLRSGFLR